ncbi:MAG: hypothetical protein EHM71_17485 [Zetaproteobacteria bacterium]|nr:MAG: hypothetical protein EHM71_17485 [Zetaproteobacteria bacterium]
MDLATVRAFFLWCTILNGALLGLSVLIVTCAGDWVYRVQGTWFGLSRETFNVAIYSFIGLFKVVVLVLNAVPYVALLIVG